MIYIVVVFASLMVFAACGMHVAACGLHVWAVERISNPQRRAEYEGVFYRYCKFVSKPFAQSTGDGT